MPLASAARALVKRFSKPAEEAVENLPVPQLRGSKHEYDPSFESPYLKQPGTFASSDLEEALAFGFGNRGDRATYFSQFPSLKPEEIFDPAQPGVLREYFSSSGRLKELEKDEMFRDTLEAIERDGHWSDIELFIQQGLLDDIPSQYKAIRLRGEADNYTYLGRRVPQESEIRELQIPERKHYVDALVKLNKAVHDPASDSSTYASLADEILGNTELPPLLRHRMLDFIREKETGRVRLKNTNITSANDFIEEATIQILNSVNTKEEAKDLLKNVLIEPSRDRVPSGSKAFWLHKQGEADIDAPPLPTPEEVVRLLDAAPDEGFNMFEFIKQHKLYNYVLPALGISLASQDDEGVQ